MRMEKGGGVTYRYRGISAPVPCTDKMEEGNSKWKNEEIGLTHAKGPGKQEV